MLNVHFWPDRTFAVAVTLPPPAGTGDGVTLNDVMVGPAAGLADLAVLATAEVDPRTASNEPSPAAISENLTAPTIPIPQTRDAHPDKTWY
jgi:hypothetical protein